MIFQKKDNGNIHVTDKDGNVRSFSCKLNVLPHPTKGNIIIISAKSRVEAFSGDFSFSWQDITTPTVTDRNDAIDKLAENFFNIENYFFSLISRNSEPPHIVEEISGGYYIGWAAPGTENTTEAAFLIKKVTEAASITTIKYADGSTKKDKVWDDRATYTYKYPV